MSRDGAGTYSLPEAGFVNGTTIDADAVNSDLSDIASALTNSLANDGQTVPSANLPMGGFKHTGVADGTARTDYASLGQVAKGTIDYAADTGAADVYAIAPSPGIAANVVGFKAKWKVTNANLTTTPTLAVNGLTAGTIVWPNGAALTAGDLPAGAVVECIIASLSGSTPTWHLQTTGRAPVQRTGNETIGGNKTFTGDLTLNGANTYAGVNDFQSAGGTALVPLAAPGDSTRNAASTAFVAAALKASMGKGIWGLTYANNVSDATNDIDIAAGGCMDATGAYPMLLSALTKRLDAAWAVGTNQGGLDTGSIGNSDYYIWAIARSDTSVTDILFSVSATAPTMPASYDYKRLIGWFKRSGGAIVAFHTYEMGGGGLEFAWDAPTLDINLANTLTTTRRTDAVKVPLDFSVIAHLNVVVFDASSNFTALVTCPDQTDAAASGTAAPLASISQTAGTTSTAQAMRIRTSAAGLIAARADIATVDLYAVTTNGFAWSRR